MDEVWTKPEEDYANKRDVRTVTLKLPKWTWMWLDSETYTPNKADRPGTLADELSEMIEQVVLAKIEAAVEPIEGVTWLQRNSDLSQ